MSILKDRIWITCKTRMYSERRYRLYDVTSHIFLSYMSLLIIIAAVFSDELSKSVSHFGAITIILSLFLFATTLIVSGFKFSETANKHRDCYLKLQNLEQTFDQHADAAAAYDQILNLYPNHAQRDYEALVLDRTLFGRGSLMSGQTKITWDYWILFKKISRFISFWVLIISVPLYISYLFLWPFLFGISLPR